MREAYSNDVAVLPPERVESIIKSAGFGSSVQFFQAGLIHAWFSKRGAVAPPHTRQSATFDDRRLRRAELRLYKARLSSDREADLFRENDRLCSSGTD